MAKGELSALRAMANADPDFQRAPEMYEYYVVGKLDTWKKRRRSVGNGNCPILPQAATGAPKVRFWIRGPKVKGNPHVPVGTVIASGWDEYRKYPNRRSGNHAAIYLGQDSKGLKVLDQWQGKEADIKQYGFERTLPFGLASVSNGGDHFYVVLSCRFSDIEFMMMKIQEAHATSAAFGS